MFTVVVDRPGRDGLEITPLQESMRFASAAVGGFADASFTVEGDAAVRADQVLPYLSKVRVYSGSLLLWEGRIEDRDRDFGGDAPRCNVVCFGFKKILEDSSLKRVWSLRSIPWQPSLSVSGLGPVQGTTPVLRTDTMFVTVGQFDPTDPTRAGVLADNYSGSANALGNANWASYRLPDGITLVRTYAKVKSLSTGRPFCQDSPDGESWNVVFGRDSGVGAGHGTVVPELIRADHTPNARIILLGSMSDGAGGNNGSWEDIRLLCTAVDEDEEGGIFGGSILRDALAFAAGVGVGRIDDGSEFALPALARTSRDSVQSVVDEVAAFYTKQWAVWEGPEFTWREPTSDDPQWAIPLSTWSRLSLSGSIAETPKRVYILYEEAATGEPSEQYADATSPQNPFSRSDASRDIILQAPVVMTAASALRLAQRVVEDAGRFPVVRGNGELPAEAILNHASGAQRPALALRGGDVIAIPGLPKTDALSRGRDGETVFQVAKAETNMEAGVVKVELDAYLKRSSVLLGRLAAVTRTVTG